jgi:hypothetical protein
MRFSWVGLKPNGKIGFVQTVELRSLSRPTGHKNAATKDDGTQKRRGQLRRRLAEPDWTLEPPEENSLKVSEAAH